MELLLKIKTDEITDETNLQIREASRAILFDENNLIPLLFVSKCNYHKLPGGGIDAGENKDQALIRECLEEVGCTISVTGEVGKIIEYRSKFKLKQTSYCYLGEIITKGKPNFTEDELNDGFKIVWLTLDNAIATVKNDKPEGYEGPFIHERDLKFLETAREIVS